MAREAPALGTILVPLDGSVFAEAALPVARTLASSLDGELVLMQAVPPPGPRLTTGVIGPALLVDPHALLEAARAYVRQVADHVARDWHMPLPRVDVRLGQPAAAIADAVGEHRVGLIVLATHGQPGLHRLLGSVTHAVSRRSPVPQVLVRPRVP